MSTGLHRRRRYVHALGARWLNPFFDPLVRLTLQDARFKTELLEQARVESGHCVLDLGCGTGTLLVMLQRARPDVRAAGVDGDTSILTLAATKAQRTGGQAPLAAALADRLPFPAACFDRVVSTLLFHHLERPTKRAALAECLRVLRPGGELHIADWGRPHTRAMRVLSTAVRWLDGLETTADNFAGRLPVLMRDAGFDEVAETCARSTLFGTLCFYRGRRRATGTLS